LAIAANPLVLLAVALTAVIALIVAFSDKISISSTGLVTLADLGKAVFNTLGTVIKELVNLIASIFKDMSGDAEVNTGEIIQFFLAMLRTILSVVEKQIGFILGLLKAVGVGLRKLAKREFADLGGAVKDAFLEGLQSNILTGAFDKVLDEAERLALERTFGPQLAAIREKKEKEAVPPPEPPVIPPPVATAGGVTFEEVLADLALETELLKLNSTEREIKIALLSVEDQLERELQGTEEKQVRTLLENNRALQEFNSIMESVITPQQQLTESFNQITLAQERGLITMAQYTEALRILGEESLKFRTDIDAGVARGIERLKTELQDLASLSENTIVNAFQGAEDAIVSFVTTGELNFKKLVDSILADLTRLLLRQALLSLIPGLGAAGGALASLPGKQQGGSFKVGGSGGPDTQLVAFRATPGEKVTVEKPGQAQPVAAAAPEVNVRAVTVFDPAMALDALGTAAGERVIVNIVERNKNTFRRILGG